MGEREPEPQATRDKDEGDAGGSHQSEGRTSVEKDLSTEKASEIAEGEKFETHASAGSSPELESSIPAEKGPDTEDVSGVPTKAADAGEPEYEYIKGLKLALVIGSISLVVFLMLLDMSIIVTAIPRITSDFHSLSDVGWYGSAYLLASCTLQPLTGKFFTHFKSKPTFLAFLGVFEFGSVICGVARSSNMLIVGRAVAGLGGSGLVNGALTIIAASLPLHKRPAMMGVMMAFSQLGIIGGPLIGGSLTQYATWRWCFFINLPIGGVAALFLLAIKIPDRVTKSAEKMAIKTIVSKFDLVGFFLFAPLAIMFLMALEWGGIKYPWSSAKIIGLLCGSAGMLVVFAAWEYHVGDEAMIPYSMIKNRVVWSSCAVIILFFGSLLVFTYYLPIYFQAVHQVSPALSGVYILPGILSQLVSTIPAGVLVGKMGYYLPWVFTSGVIVSIGAGLISTFTPHTHTAKWVGYQLIAGFGRGLGFQMPILAIQNILPPDKIPIGMSLMSFSQTFGGSILLTAAQAIFSHSLGTGLKRYAPEVDLQTVVTAGASAIRKVVKPGQVEGVLEAYNFAINRDFYLAAGASAGTCIFCWGMGWYSVKKKKKPEAPAV